MKLCIIYKYNTASSLMTRTTINLHVIIIHCACHHCYSYKDFVSNVHDWEVVGELNANHIISICCCQLT